MLASISVPQQNIYNSLYQSSTKEDRFATYYLNVDDIFCDCETKCQSHICPCRKAGKWCGKKCHKQNKTQNKHIKCTNKK